MKHVLLLTALLLAVTVYGNDGSGLDQTLEKVSIDGRMAIVEMSYDGKIKEIIQYLDEQDHPQEDCIVLEFDTSNPYLESEEVNSLKVVTYKALGTSNSYLQVTVANERSSYWRLKSVLETLQYNGLHPGKIMINIVEPTPENSGKLQLKMKTASSDYASVMVENPDDLLAGY